MLWYPSTKLRIDSCLSACLAAWMIWSGAVLIYLILTSLTSFRCCDFLHLFVVLAVVGVVVVGVAFDKSVKCHWSLWRFSGVPLLYGCYCCTWLWNRLWWTNHLLTLGSYAMVVDMVVKRFIRTCESRRMNDFFFNFHYSKIYGGNNNNNTDTTTTATKSSPKGNYNIAPA